MNHCARVLLLAWCVISVSSFAVAQDFGLAESAATIEKGAVKLRVNPTFVVADASETPPGISGALGYGIGGRMDGEFKIASRDTNTLIGGDAKFWVLRRPESFNLSLSMGGAFG